MVERSAVMLGREKFRPLQIVIAPTALVNVGYGKRAGKSC